MWQVRRWRDHPVERWRNGRGIARAVADGDGWRLRLADIGASGPFSDYDGTERWLAIVAGSVVLRLTSGQVLPCDETCPILSFPGAPGPACELIGAPPARALNLFLSGGRVRGRIERRRLGDAAPTEAAAPARSVAPAGSVVAIVIQCGRVRAADTVLDPGDALVRDALVAEAADSDAPDRGALAIAGPAPAVVLLVHAWNRAAGDGPWSDADARSGPRPAP